MDKTAIVLKAPLDDEPGKYALLIHRGPYGSSIAVYVDRLVFEYDNDDVVTVIAGYVGDDLVVMFPAGTQYLLVSRDKIEMLTAEEAAQRNKAEEDVVNAVWGRKPGSLDPISAMMEAAGPAVGQYL